MPTAEAYRAGAMELRAWLDSMPALESAVGDCRDAPGFAGSTVADAIPPALTLARAHLVDARSACEELVAELDRRARLCDVHAEAMREWETLHARWREDEFLRSSSGAAGGPGRPEPTRPDPPFPGAEAG